MNNEREPKTGQELSREQQETLRREGQERVEQLRENLERRTEAVAEQQRGPEREAISHEARELAASGERSVSDQAPAEKKPDVPIANTKVNRDMIFRREMKHIQSEMSAPSRGFSKVIHNKAVERASEAIGSTVARPNAILAGAICAFLFTLALYVLAKRLGYVLSGFETIGAFALGWVVGLVFDFLRVMISGKRGA